MSAERKNSSEEAKVNEPKTAPHGNDRPAIYGGESEGSRLLGFLESWDFSSMTYRIFEYSDRIDFTFTQPLDPGASARLERGRVFGLGGDLALRRDGSRFLWHFIGDPGVQIPSGYGGRNFWDENAGTELQLDEGSALLWGEYRGKNLEGQQYWQDDRVAWARLFYPGPPAKRLRLNYWVFSDGGQIAFVWYRELKNA